MAKLKSPAVSGWGGAAVVARVIGHRRPGARNAILLDLGAELAPVFLADLLGMH